MNQSLLILLLMCIGAVVYGICRIALVIARSYRRESRFLGDAELQVLLATYQYGKSGEAARWKTAAPASAPKTETPFRTDVRRRLVRRASRRADAAAAIRRDRSKRSRETRRFRPAEKRRSVRPRAVRTGASERERRRRR